MRYNPAASFDLGAHIAVTGSRDQDIDYVALASTCFVDIETVDFGVTRTEAALDAWIGEQIAAAEQLA